MKADGALADYALERIRHELSSASPVLAGRRVQPYDMILIAHLEKGRLLYDRACLGSGATIPPEEMQLTGYIAFAHPEHREPVVIARRNGRPWFTSDIEITPFARFYDNGNDYVVALVSPHTPPRAYAGEIGVPVDSPARLDFPKSMKGESFAISPSMYSGEPFRPRETLESKLRDLLKAVRN